MAGKENVDIKQICDILESKYEQFQDNEVNRMETNHNIETHSPQENMPKVISEQSETQADETPKNESPLVSVVMPVYNTEYEYLKIAIESILNQTYSNFELIIVDDCSVSDIFRELITQYQDERIHFIRNEEHLGIGASNARNIGMRYAQGKYIAVLDSDDYAYPERLEKQVEFMENNDEIGILGTKYRQIPNEFIYDKTGSDDYLKALCLLYNPPFGHSTVMMRKSLIDETGIQYHNDVICDDYRMWLDMIDKTCFANLNEVLIDYRYHEDNISHEQEANLNWDARQSQVRSAFRLMDKPLSEDSEYLLCRFLTGQTLGKEQLNKALYLHAKMVDYCENMFGIGPTKKALSKSYFSLLQSAIDPEYQSLLRNPHVQDAFRIDEDKQVCSFQERVLKDAINARINEGR